MEEMNRQTEQAPSKSYRCFYIGSLLLLAILSAYPIYMGFSVLFGSQYRQAGFIYREDYPKYIIPYTPMCIAILLAAALLPVFRRFAKRIALLLDSLLGIGIFLVLEWFFERIQVVDFLTPGEGLPVSSWQYSLCIATPQVLQSIGEAAYADRNPAYKMHFYMIAIVIILCVLGILYGYMRMFKEGCREKKRPLLLQTVCVSVFVGMCILACFTAFFREGVINLSPLSAFLTGSFFLLFGITFGAYFAGFLYGKRPLLSVTVPALCAAVTTICMYIGELILMGGELFIFGKGWFFHPLGKIPFSLCDLLIIAAAGALTGLIAKALNKIQRCFPG